MPACLDAAFVDDSGRLRSLSMYIPAPLPSDSKAQTCGWVVQSGEEFARAQSEQQELESMFLPCILVVIFVLGWIAGAQR